MKIFNWVHRRFHHKDRFGHDMKKSEFEANQIEKQALLKHIALANVIDVWGEGILTIGTFGFDPLKDFNQQNYCDLITDKENEEYHDDGEEDLVDNESNYIDDDEEEEDEGEHNPLVYKNGCKEIEPHFDENDTMMDNESITQGGELDIECDEGRKKRGERITLADLFSADSDTDEKGVQDNDKVEVTVSIKKQSPHAKNGLSFAKKLIPRVGEDSHPIQKLHRLMTRMTKRKIHPDLEGKFQKMETQNKASVLGLLKNEHGAKFESLSLLQTQDVIVCG